jgi:transcriptional regulator with XRE-family HTH domain
LNRARRLGEDQGVGADLASIIVEARRGAGLNQAELARRAGISASYLSRIESAAWEKGGPWPADNVLRSLARALGLSSTELVALRREARDHQAASHPRGHLGRANGRTPYSVSVGACEVDAAARGLIERNPPRGTMRSAQVFLLDPPGRGAADHPP